MKQADDAAAALSPIKRALLEITSLRARLAELERAGREPIAVVGMACRVPGAANIDAYWHLLMDGREGIGFVPNGRWSQENVPHLDPLVHRAGFIADADLFDAAFFGISPREALAMDPQHRLVLELGWHALEHAAIVPTSLRNSATGVFLGISGSDYAHLAANAPEVQFDRYRLPGSGLSFAPGRLAHFLGLQGPSMAIDTACSSSLVAVHLACRSLRSMETDLCLAGGVNLIAAPGGTAIAAQFGMLAKDSRCKTFDAAADGFVRGEGGGMIVLKRLADAVRERDQIFAVIAGSAVNQDGPSSGLTVPNGQAQQQVIRSALRDAGLAPADIAYVEAHGTGTALGDPIELNALNAVLAEGRSSNETFWVGAVKTNIGHLESAAGIAGLIKAILVLAHRRLPPNRNLVTPSPMIPWDRLSIRLPTAAVDLPHHVVSAGVSAFGASGTNAHVILRNPNEAPIAPPNADRPARLPHIVCLSAREPAALVQLARDWQTRIREQPTLELADIGLTSTNGRTAFRFRRVILAASTTELAERLEFVAREETADGIIAGTAPTGEPPKIAFLFTGQGSQQIGMARELYESEPTFRSVLQRCDRLLSEFAAPFREHSLLSRLYGASDGIGTATEIVQPALFAIEYALAALWQSWGIVPHAVAGHSLGEYVAACVAGVFSLDDALRLVTARGTLMQSIRQRGAMAMLFAGEARVAEIMGSDAVVIAAVNAPDEVTISGDDQAVAAVVERARLAGVQTRSLPVSHAFHSPLMDPILDAFTARVESVPRHAPKVRIIGNVTGSFTDAEMVQASYWRRHLREPVRFAESITTLKNAGYSHFVEVGPRPVLLGLVRRTFPDAMVLAPSLRPGQRDRTLMLESLATLFVHGAPIDWRAVFAPDDARRTTLPPYPFQRQRFWVQTNLAAEPTRPVVDSDKPDVLASSPDEDAGDIQAVLRRCIAEIVRLAPAKIDPTISLRELGLDSLMAVELQASIKKHLGVSIPWPDLLVGPSLQSLAAALTAPATNPATSTPSSYIAPPHPASALVGASAKLRLVCFPYAAAGASIFRTWQAGLSSDIDVRPIQLPGREERLREKPFEDPDALIDELVTSLASIAERPIALYGHSLGAWLAFETACRLERDKRFRVAHLFVAACSPPHLPNPLHERNRDLVRAIDAQDESVVFQALASRLPRARDVFDGTMPELFRAILPAVRADLQLLERYVPRSPHRLSCPVTVFGGRQDTDFPPSLLDAWRIHTSGEFTVNLIEGGHLFLQEARETLLHLIAQAINQQGNPS